MQPPFRVGLQISTPAPGATWVETARRAEDAGVDTLYVPDHFGDQYGPIAGLAAAAVATTELRVGALVYGNDYRHPVVLAKELATIEALAPGRLVVGMGAGWMRTDYEQSGMSYDRPGLRIERLEESLQVLRSCFAEGAFSFSGAHYTITDYDGQPVPPAMPPFLIGGGGRRMLGVAGRHADIVGLTANLRAGEIGPDAIADLTPEAFDEKRAWAIEAAGERGADLEFSSLAMHVEVTDDRAGSLAGLSAMFGMPVDVIGQTPVLLVGSVDEIVDSLLARRERWGFNVPVLQGHDFDTLAAICSRLADA